MRDTTGDKLRKARLARNLSLSDVAQATRIPADKVEAIEVDDYSQFPSMAYARGFLVLYGRFLAVDVSEQATLLEGHNALHARDYQYLDNIPAPPLSDDSLAPRERSPSIVPLIVFLVILTVVGGALWLLMNLKRLGLSFW